MFERATRKSLAVALVALAGLVVAHAMPASAQRARATGIAEQFEAKAKERSLRKRAAPAIPDFQRQQRGGEGRSLLILKTVDVEGATALTQSEISSAYQAFLGKSISEADLRKIANGVTEMYRQRGYALTRAFVPAQDVRQGRIRIRVLEGYIEEVVVEGNVGNDFGVARMLSAVTHERPLRLATLERHLLLASDTPGLHIQDTALEEKGETTGRFRLIVNLEAWRTFASVDLDNRGSPDTGPLQSFVVTALNSALVPGDAWAINYASVPDSPEELAYLGGVAEFPLGPQGARIGLKASSSSIRPDDDSSSTVRSQELGMYMSYAPLRTRETSLKFTAMAGLRHAKEEDPTGTIYDDHIRAVSLSAEYQQRDSFGGANYAVLTGRVGLPIFGASNDGDAQLSNPAASGEFYKAFWGLTRHQNFGGAWSALLSTTGQLAFSELLQSEDFYIGGPMFGRAFAAGDVSGASGVAGLLEVRFDGKYDQGPISAYQLYAFLDGGVVWNRGGADRQSLSSYGAGIRLSLQDDLRAGLEVALPIGLPSLADVESDTKFYFSLSKSFKGCPEAFCPR